MDHYVLASVSPAAIKEANKAVKSVTSVGKSKWRGSYVKFSPEQQAAIGKYAPHTIASLRKIPSSIEPGCDLSVCIIANGRVLDPNRPIKQNLKL